MLNFQGVCGSFLGGKWISQIDSPFVRFGKDFLIWLKWVYFSHILDRDVGLTKQLSCTFPCVAIRESRPLGGECLQPNSAVFSETKQCLSNEIPGCKIWRKKSLLLGIGCSSLSKIRVVDPHDRTCHLKPVPIWHQHLWSYEISPIPWHKVGKLLTFHKWCTIIRWCWKNMKNLSWMIFVVGFSEWFPYWQKILIRRTDYLKLVLYGSR